MKQKFNIIESSCIPLPIENVDTDQIIPARFLKATTRDEKFFGENLFRDWRYAPDGSMIKDFVLNDPRYSGCILVAGATLDPDQAASTPRGLSPATDSELWCQARSPTSTATMNSTVSCCRSRSARISLKRFSPQSRRIPQQDSA